jgi:3-phosphoshikimate 1-carboxyvinyltransferase
MKYQPGEFSVEADASSASYFLAAALITGGVVEVSGLVRNGLQPDAGFVDVLELMGAAVSWNAGGLRLAGPGGVRAVDVDMNRMPDAVPGLTVTALFADGPTRIRNVGHLRFKESDRLEALTSELRAVGADIRCEGESLIITPCELHGATLDPRNDHRLAMSFALIGLRIPGIMITGPGCVAKSFPRFWEELENIQG